MLVIDGQQRLTTLFLLLSALSRAIEEQDCDIGITPRRLSNYYLFNSEEEGELRYKQLLTKHDKETLIHLLENRELLPTNPSVSVVKNYRFFEAKLKQVDLKSLYAGIEKLMIVDIALDRSEDNPQLIFESLNSTGLGLSQADIIRNYVLMGQEPNVQNSLYDRYWFLMEQHFGDQYRKRFDRKDVYNFNRWNYLLRKLENYERKEPIEKIADYTIEHVMPQKLTDVWEQELGSDYQRIHGIWLHKIGNLTLTGYNSEYSNKSFKEKQAKPQTGFRYSPLYLNQSLAHVEQWNEDAIIARSNELSEKALQNLDLPRIKMDALTMTDEQILEPGFKALGQAWTCWNGAFYPSISSWYRRLHRRKAAMGRKVRC